MLAFQAEKGKLRLVDKPAPKLRPEWARVRVRLAGICNTDVEILRGRAETLPQLECAGVGAACLRGAIAF